ncbi:hypothetical protein JY651_10210 [Pyxidicoccus parkwayensis]|uniref:Uncharacterized protein n=1 Tax=Pyxidicoccus parkwayensis TaxID=2813578 RepID=A0ABX7P466_9BACT|nr:hypothetical protein [Pyxidicoccus parkwaysis]QSQ25269.1 hypothetical protein JY651_10210 [Pyxidicoccus parkwaysis]
MSLKNLVLLVFTSALILTGCGGGSPPAPPNPGTPTAKKLAFTVQPSGAASGVALSPAVQVTVQSADGKTIPGAKATVTLALKANPAGGTLAGAAPVQATQGVATFAGLSLDKAGGGYTLVAHADGLEDAESQPFAISAGPAHQLAFADEPGELEAGGTFAPPVRVAVRDAAGNPVTSGTPVTLALGANPAGGTFSGTLKVTSADGVAVFPELSLDKAGEGYTLVASAQGLDSVTSRAFRVKPGKAKSLAFVTQPSATVAGQAVTPAVQVRLVDAHGNTATGTAGDVTLALGANATGATLDGTVTVAAVDGLASFTDLSVARAGDYTLAASSAGLTGATSNSFTVTSGTGMRLAFRAQPLGAVAGSDFAPAVEVVVQDARGNVAGGFSGPVTVALDANPTGDTLRGTLTVNAVAGVARFEALSLTRAGAGYSLAATSPGLAPAGSLPFDVTAAPAARLVFALQPSGQGAGVVLTPAPRVAVQDAFGNPVSSSTAAITVALSGGTPGAVLGGTATVSAVGGEATFAGLSVDRKGSGYTLAASSPGLTGATSASFDILHGAPVKLAFLAQPGTATAGAALNPAVKVVVQDVNGDTASTSVFDVTVALGANAAGGSLSGTRTVTTVDGVATFASLSLDKAGTGYTLVASATNLTSATSSAFDVTHGGAARLSFRAQPSNAAAGVSFSPAVEVSVLDASGNIVTSSSAAITLALGNNPGSATLSGTLTVNAAAGVATFAGLSLDKAGSGYTLAASAQGLTGATSAAFDIQASVPSRLAFHVAPSNAPAGEALSPAVVVRIEDAFGNRTASTASIAIALGGNSSGATLSGTLAVAAVAGEATFSSLSLDKVGTGYTLTASSPGLAPATSGAFDISANTATQLAFTAQPSDVAAGTALSPSVQVTLLDAFGNRVDSSASVTLALGANPGGATLSGVRTVNSVNGRATFSGLSLDKVGTGYTLVATSSGVTDATSSAFDVRPGAAARLAFRVQPSTVVAGAPFSPSLEVLVLDAFDNRTASTAQVTVALNDNPGGATLSGTATQNAAAGVATFDVSLDKAGTGYTLVATSPGLTDATSSAFDVQPAEAARLAFTAQPSNATAGEALAPAVEVTVQDAFGNTVPSATTITLALGDNPGGGTLGGTRSVDSAAGVAGFSTLTVDRAGAGYTLVASAEGLTPATSSTFAISAAEADRLAWRVQPSNTVAGEAITPAVEVEVQDRFGNTVTDSPAVVTVELGTTPGGGPLSGTLEQTTDQGVARFATLTLTKVAADYTLVASSPGLASVSSSPFDVTPAPAAALAFTVQPSNVVAGAAITPSVAVVVRDAFGNTATSSTATLQLALGSNPGGGTLSGTLSVDASGGAASFPGISVNKAGASYTLTVSSPGLTSADSSAFDVTPGAAAALAFTVQPSDVTAGGAITPSVAVSVVDANGNTVTTATNSITMAIGNNPGVGILNGTKTVSAVSGTATFPGLSITKTGEGYTLTAAASGFTTRTSAAFNVTPGAATSLAFYTNPPNVVTAGAAITPSVKVGVRDSFGNTVTGSTASITLSLSANPGGSTLGGTLTANAVDGVATFPDLTLDKAANNYRFAAASTGLTSNTSSLFIVQAGAASKLAFTTQPANVTAGATFSTSVKVTVQDAFGNVVTTPSINVGIVIGNNPGGATLGGTSTVATASGVATFSNLTLSRTGTGYTLVASSGTLPAVASTAFDVSAGAASQLVFTVAPTNTTAGASFTPDVQVGVRDASGNPVTSSTASITLALGNNPGGGTLAGTTTVTAVGGVATFPGVSLARAGTGYTLTASSTGLAAATSVTFDVAPGAGTQLAFTVQPSRAFANQPITPAVRVSVLDAFGNVSTGASNTVTVALGNNPGSATLGGTLGVSAVSGVASFADLVLNAMGTGYTLTASSGTLTAATSVAFDVVSAGGRFVYVDPAVGGRRIALVRNPSSTDTTAVLDLVAMEDLTGYSVGMNLPVDTSLVQANSTLMVPGDALPAGTAPTAAYGKLPSSGPLAGVLTSGQSQKVSGPGAVAGDTAIAAGSVLYTVRMDLKPGATTGVVFDGAALGPKFNALLRDRLGADVVNQSGFAIGRLEVQ